MQELTFSTKPAKNFTILLNASSPTFPSALSKENISTK
jgi:hypothetical protein